MNKPMNVRVKSRLKEKKKKKKESHEKKSEITKGKKNGTLLYKSRKKVKITVCRWDEEKYRPKEQHTNLFQRADTNLFV